MRRVVGDDPYRDRGGPAPGRGTGPRGTPTRTVAAARVWGGATAVILGRVKKQMSRMSAALRRPTESGQLWRQVLFFVPVPLPVLGVVALTVGGRFSAPGWTILLAGSVAVAALLLALMVQPTPLPEGLSAEASVRRSLHRFRQITALRVALALTPVAVGA